MQALMHLVVFILGGERYALPIEQVREIIRHQPPRRIAARVPWVAGVIGLRGAIVPVCEIAARIGARPARTDEPKIVVVDLRGGPAGVIVDGVDQVVEVPQERLRPVPPEVSGALVRAIATLDGELVMVLDAERVLAGVVPPPAEPEPAPAEPAARKPASPRRKRAPKPAPAQPSR